MDMNLKIRKMRLDVNILSQYIPASRRLHDKKITWYADDNAPLDARYLFEHRNRTYLLTWDQNEAVLDGEDMPACALRLVE